MDDHTVDDDELLVELERHDDATGAVGNSKGRGAAHAVLERHARDGTPAQRAATALDANLKVTAVLFVGARRDLPMLVRTPRPVRSADVAGAKERGLSLADWGVLGVVAEGSTHGWTVVRTLAPDGPLGRVWSVSRPIVYRSLDALAALGYIEKYGEERGSGPARTMVRATRAGRSALTRWLARPSRHVRDARSELLLKLALLDRRGQSPRELLERQLAAYEPVFAAVLKPRDGDRGFESQLTLWRREQALAVRRFLRKAAAQVR